mgnify:CR=1 FL=1
MQQNSWKLLDFEVGLNQPLFLMAGPCVIESEQLAIDTAGYLKEVTSKLGINFIYKSLYNFRAANYMRFSSIEVIKQNVLVNKIFETPQAKLMSITELKELAESKIINSF